VACSFREFRHRLPGLAGGADRIEALQSEIKDFLLL
jgi:hypothetical protein